MSDCVFCNLDQIAGLEWCADHQGYSIYRFPPLNPVTEGHMLFIANIHTADAARDPMVFGGVAEIAAWWVRGQKIAANIITSVGPEATQTVFHTHVHVVPRVGGDTLALPWTDPQPRTVTPEKGNP